jgi:conjugal transfer pilus assembly protein TraE
MNLATYRSHLEKIISQRNGYLVMASGLILLCLLQSIVIIFSYGRERIVIVPATIEKSFWVDSNNVSPEYLSLMTKYYLSLRFNLTPENVAEQREELLRYIDPAYYSDLKSRLVQEEDRIREQHINMVFYPVDVKENTKKMQVIVDGDLKINIGDAPIPTKRTRYLISYRYRAGRLLIKSFEEVKNA